MPLNLLRSIKQALGGSIAPHRIIKNNLTKRSKIPPIPSAFLLRRMLLGFIQTRLNYKNKEKNEIIPVSPTFHKFCIFKLANVLRQPQHVSLQYPNW